MKQIITLIATALITLCANATTELYDFTSVVSSENTRIDLASADVVVGENTFGNRFTVSRFDANGGWYFRYASDTFKGLFSPYDGRTITIKNLKAGNKVTVTTSNGVAFNELASGTEKTIETDGDLTLTVPKGGLYIETVTIVSPDPVPSAYTTVWSNDFVELASSGDANVSLNTALERNFRDDGNANRTIANSSTSGINENIYFRSDCTWALKKDFGLRQTRDWGNVIIGINGVKAGDRIVITTAEPVYASVTVASSYTDYAVLDEENSTSTCRVFNVLKDASETYTSTEGKMPIFTIGKNSDYIKSITVEKPKYKTITIGSEGYATVVATEGLDFTESEGIAAYYVKVNGTTANLISTSSVPANTAFVVKGNTGNYDVPFDAEVTGTPDNDLKYSESTKTPAENWADNYYVLAKPAEGEVGFYAVEVGTTIPAYKGYLQINKEVVNYAKAITFSFNDTTTINNIKNTEGNIGVCKFIQDGRLVIKTVKGRYNMAGSQIK